MLSQLLAIFRNTFVESIRQPIAIVVIIACKLTIILSVAGAANTLDDDNLLFIPLGLSTLLLGGLFLAGFTATGVVSLEIENKTALTVVSKPVRRPLFILGKYLGVAAALLLTLWPMICNLLMWARHGVMQTAAHHHDIPVILFNSMAFFGALFVALMLNYLYRWPFVSTYIWMLNLTMTLALLLVLVVSKEWALQPLSFEFTREDSPFARFIVAIVLLIETLLIFCAIAVMISTRLGQVLTILITLGVGFGMSIIGPYHASVGSPGPLMMQAVIGIGLGVILLFAAVIELIGAALNRWVFTQARNIRLAFDLALGAASLAFGIYRNLQRPDGTESVLAGVGRVGVELAYHVVPVLDFLWVADDLGSGLAVTGAYLNAVTAYSFLLIVAMLGVAVALFQTREVG